MVQKIKIHATYLYRHTFIRYVFVGGTTFVIDLALLAFGYEVAHFSLSVAATISYWTSIAYNFSLNRWWAFNASESKAIHEHALLYGLLLSFNYLFTLVFINIVSDVIHYGWAKVLATGIQISWTYLIYKKYIFR